MGRKGILHEKDLLSKEYMEKMTTKRLLAYLGRLNACHDTKNWDEMCNKDEVTKDSIIWREKINEIKNILSKREHVERK